MLRGQPELTAACIPGDKARSHRVGMLDRLADNDGGFTTLLKFSFCLMQSGYFWLPNLFLCDCAFVNA